MPRCLTLALGLLCIPQARCGAQVAPGAAQVAPGGDAEHVLFVGLESEDAVAIVDPVAGRVLEKIPVGISGEDIEGVHALTTSPDGRHYYLAIAHGWPNGAVWKMSPGSDSLAGRAGVGLFPATMALTPDGTWLFVANYNLHGDPALDTVSAVHTPTMTEVAQIPVCTKPHGMVASRDGRWIYASCTRDDVVRKISVESRAVVDSTNMRTAEDRDAGRACYPAGLALSADGGRLFVACHRHAEVRVVATDPLGAPTNAIPTGEGPYLIRTDPGGERLWVPNRSDQSYTVIDVAREEAIATRPASATHPHTFAFGPDGTVYLSMESHGIVPGAIDVIDPASLETRRSIPVGLQATGVGVIPLPPSRFGPR